MPLEQELVGFSYCGDCSTFSQYRGVYAVLNEIIISELSLMLSRTAIRSHWTVRFIFDCYIATVQEYNIQNFTPSPIFVGQH